MLALFIAQIADLYPGWSPSSGPSARPADFEPPGGRFVVAYVDDRPVGCGGLKRLDPRAAEIKRLYVCPEMRRQSLARQLLDHLEAVAAGEGFEVVGRPSRHRRQAAERGAALLRGRIPGDP